MIINTGALSSRRAALHRCVGPALVAGLLALGVLAAPAAQAAKTNTTTQLAASPTSAHLGESVTLTASVSPANATGTVTFKDGATTIGTASLSSGSAALSKSFSSTGTHSLTAVYGGTSAGNGFNPSTSAATPVSVIAKVTTSTALSSSVNPSSVGQSTTLTATVSPSTASGSVTFKDGSTTLGTATLAAGVATLTKSFSSTGAHSLTAQYAGDAGNNASTSSTLTQSVTAQAASTTSLNANPSPAASGQAVTLSASVSPTSATGTVTFKDGATSLGSGTLSGGVASWSTSALAQGTHSLSASYAGDALTASSTSSAQNVQIVTPVALPNPPVSPVPVANYEYDAQGNLTKTIQAPGVSGFNFATQASYDALSRRKDTTDAKSGVTQYGYDGLDRTTSITDPRSLVTQYPRNGLGDTTSLVSPDTGTASHSYDAAGNLTTRTDSRGVLATYSYDALNRQTGISYSQSGQTSLAYSWTYDQTGAGFSNGIGRLTSTSHPNGSTQYAYDPQGRVTSETQSVSAQAGANPSAISKSVGYGYTNGQLTSLTYPSGRVLSLTYTAGQLSGLALAKDASSTPSTLLDQISYAPFGAPVSWNWQMASGPQANARVYDTSGRLVRYRMGSTVRDLTYDAADRITGYTHYDTNTGSALPSLDQSFGYDELGRLTSITTATASWSIGYDANGNRTGVTLNGAPSSYTTEATSNRLTSISNPARSFGYDNAGNTTSDSTSYTSGYNLAGRLTTLTKSGITSSFSYDGMGRRVRKVNSSGAASTVVFVYDKANRLLGEYDSAGSPIREYVWLGSTPVAMFTPDPANSTNPPLAYVIHADHIDTPRVVTDTGNNIRWRWMAEPFGTTAPENNPSNLGAFTQNLRFPGQYADAETALNYNGARYYDSSIGRYPQSDPIGLAGGSHSTYAYVGANPMQYVDPSGLWSTAAHNYILLMSLSGLTATELQYTQEGSAWVDRFENQFGDGSPQHAMRNVGQSIEDARNQACRFIRGHLAVYERFKNSPIAKYRASAFRSLGAALHPVMDSTSPEHAGWQMWDPLGHPGQIFEHGNLSSEDVFHLTPVLLQETKRRIEAVLRGDPCSCIL